MCIYIYKPQGKYNFVLVIFVLDRANALVAFSLTPLDGIAKNS